LIGGIEKWLEEGWLAGCVASSAQRLAEKGLCFEVTPTDFLHEWLAAILRDQMWLLH